MTNIRLGLFRLWIVASTLFLIAAVYGYSGSVRDEFKKARKENHALMLPLKCEDTEGKKVRGVVSDDYVIWNSYCWYQMSKFRALYPEYKNVSDDALTDAIYAKIGSPLEHAHPWRLLFTAASIAVGLPLAILAIVSALYWAVLGFRAKRAAAQ
jgi:hypothetical protein